MSHPINSKIYEWILENEAFINDIWNRFDATTKVEILEKSGVVMLDEYAKTYGEAQDDQDSLL